MSAESEPRPRPDIRGFTPEAIFTYGGEHEAAYLDILRPLIINAWLDKPGAEGELLAFVRNDKLIG